MSVVGTQAPPSPSRAARKPQDLLADKSSDSPPSPPKQDIIGRRNDGHGHKNGQFHPQRFLVQRTKERGKRAGSHHCSKRVAAPENAAVRVILRTTALDSRGGKAEQELDWGKWKSGKMRTVTHDANAATTIHGTGTRRRRGTKEGSSQHSAAKVGRNTNKTPEG